ncbi:hypothetical protein NECAME_16256 [Necator americanus]|uniref:Uncharacterized protein n=1 Tax=Necator americanus TaxID=51031 RepID=W2TY11_NECAM|nr:hypothetical protein NECAME_16256 [Necator americanus]ETN86569.1 hypothetical protein NECAME_16256 [Necator americanus]
MGVVRPCPRPHPLEMRSRAEITITLTSTRKQPEIWLVSRKFAKIRTPSQSHGIITHPEKQQHDEAVTGSTRPK